MGYAVAASSEWVDPDGVRRPAGEVHAWTPDTNQTLCGLALSRSRLGRYPHVDWEDVRPESGRHADAVQRVCRPGCRNAPGRGNGCWAPWCARHRARTLEAEHHRKGAPRTRHPGRDGEQRRLGCRAGAGRRRRGARLPARPPRRGRSAGPAPGERGPDRRCAGGGREMRRGRPDRHPAGIRLPTVAPTSPDGP
jgi:hypothetical protein